MSYFILLFNAVLVIANTAVFSLLICLVAVLKFALPIPAWRGLMTRLADGWMWCWATVNHGVLALSNRVDWQLNCPEGLSKRAWYLLICNHLSWTDIVVLCCVFRNQIPMPKFFLKQQLRYVPFVGMACWALNMPFMRRYSRAYLLRHPEKKGQDLEATRRACLQFRHHPTTVVNYVEGTRYTPQKRISSQSPYRHVLAPKSGGIGYAMSTMGEQFNAVIDVTLAYPDNRDTPFRDLLMGKMTRIVVDVQVRSVDPIQGNYFTDKQFKRHFQAWLHQVWQDKDEHLDRVYNDQHVACSTDCEAIKNSPQ
ncbi:MULTISPECIES: acyltransferase [unclassified Vibrio]|uniref:Acyltransferase n=1 Tax=Vibrio sp. HB236076 TaxID=3232307 RepID=A0AB39HER2_9VIBR|nr:acyltransferase [Vibrio sp. HB161653]MDP5255657.1 acyltransferase [Vibrio sp. HB161653]